MVAVVEDKIAFGRDQVVSSTQVSKGFSDIRRRVKDGPLFVSDRNAGMDTVIVSYDEFEKMAVELEKMREALFYAEAARRIEDVQNGLGSSISLQETLGDDGYADFLTIDVSPEHDADLFA